MAKKKIIYKIVGKKGKGFIVAGMSDNLEGANWIKNQYPKHKLKIVRTTTTKGIGTGKIPFEYKKYKKKTTKKKR